MHNAPIDSRDLLGPFPSILAVGEEQKQVFQEQDSGPYWMSESERMAKKYDQTTDRVQKRRRKKAELVDDLKATGMVNVGGTLAELQVLAERNNIPIHEEKQVVVEGWCGKPKGMLQILWDGVRSIRI